jgi:hypothetical protein
MGKLLLGIVVAFVAWLTLKALVRKGGGGPPSAGRASARDVERMVKCARCGVFLPETETRSLDGALTCHTPEQCPRRESAPS